LIGAEIDLAPALEAFEPSVRSALRLDALLFGETQNRVLMTCAAEAAVKVVERSRRLGVPAAVLGRVGGDQVILRMPEARWEWSLAELHDLWWHAIGRVMS
jgi:phosphoribosylformylglycinamidine synthase